MLAFAALAVVAMGKMWHDTMTQPVMRAITLPIQLPHTPTRRIVLLADIHVAGPDMPPSRLTEIVAQVGQLEPDIVLFAGDFVSDKRTATRHYTVEEALAPLAKLPDSAVKLAVPGNHDHWRDVEAIEEALAQHRIGMLRNEVSNVGGLLVAGLDDDFTGRAKLADILTQLEPFGRQALFLSHSPDPFAQLPPGSGIMLAGHTHCGQIGWPWGGAPATMSDYGDRYACGVVRENGNTLVVSAGLGTSILPIRMFTKPEIWVIELVPPR